MRNGAIAKSRLAVAQIEEICGTEVIDAAGLDYIDGITTPDRPLPHRAMFIDRFSETLASELNSDRSSSLLVFAIGQYREKILHPRILTDFPRMVFARVVERLFHCPEEPQTMAIHPTARVHPSVKISIGVTIGEDSEIGEGSYFYPHVTVGPRVRMGRNCVVKSGTVIGQPGFGVYKNAAKNPNIMPHVGGVIIGNHVDIGALNTVASGTIHPTIIEDHVKTDDHVHIAHNCRIGARTLVTACAELSGSVTVGPDCWIGPNAAVRDGIEIGANAVIGIAANVIRSVAAGETVMGNPARPSSPKNG